MFTIEQATEMLHNLTTNIEKRTGAEEGESSFNYWQEATPEEKQAEVEKLINTIGELKPFSFEEFDPKKFNPKELIEQIPPIKIPDDADIKKALIELIYQVAAALLKKWISS